jgi:hypothetical protein
MVGRTKRRRTKRTKRRSNIPKHYTGRLSRRDKKKQTDNIKKAQRSYKRGVYLDRPKLKSYKNKRSGWVQKFENKYDQKITNKTFIHKNIITRKGQDLIISKGRGAYYSSGSRPNQTADSWAYARLASVIIGGPARKSDQKIWDQYKR